MPLGENVDITVMMLTFNTEAPTTFKSVFVTAVASMMPFQLMSQGKRGNNLVRPSSTSRGIARETGTGKIEEIETRTTRSGYFLGGS